MNHLWDLFDTETENWFTNALGEPTQVQREAWPAIAAGGHVLVSAPTGTGKTLSAFLVFLDRMKRQAREGILEEKLQLIYVSPLKSLAADIRENLRRPLEGINAAEEIVVGIRTGDTTQRERQLMIKHPPHILIITPESLYLMLTGKNGQKVLATAEAVVLDELHALIDTKRGAHLMLSLARLDYICKKPLQRIGLSATIEPLSVAAEYLAPEEVRIIAPLMTKKKELLVTSPFIDATAGARKDPVWEELGKLVYQYCHGNRSVIAFVEGRRYAEKLAYYVNLLGGDGFARVHHGSLSKEQRMETEAALRAGNLRLLCATSSMELGIDVGEIDQVLQVGCPRTVSGTMQRLGRAGHNPGRVSVMYLFPRTAAECVSCGMTAELARQGGIEYVNPPSGCLDVLAQHLVSMAAFRSYEIDEVMEILPRAWPFQNITKDDVKSVLGMLAGDYEHERDVPARPRVLYDRIHERVEGDGYSRMLAVSAGGTIPDKGLYAVRTEEGVKLGEVDEEFVYESQKGDRFILGSFAWKITNISRDTVTVVNTPTEGARLPFWKGEIKGRDKRTGEAFGRMFYDLQQAKEDGRLPEALKRLGLDEAAVKLSAGYLERQIEATGCLPNHKTIIVEHFKDSLGYHQLMVHSVFGRRINAPLALLTARAAGEAYHTEVGCVDEEDGFLLYSYNEDRALPEGALYLVDPASCARRLELLLPATSLFNMAFRYNSGRALMMGVRKNGRQPLWMQRLRSAEMLNQVVREQEHPLIRETRRECMQELWDAKGVQELLYDIHSGAVQVREVYTDVPSPMSLPLQWAQEAAVMYDYAPTPRGIHHAVEESLTQEADLLRPGSGELAEVQERGKLPQNEMQLHTLLMTEGDLAAGELDIPVEWLETLAEEERVCYLEQGLWIAAEHREEYEAALGEWSLAGGRSDADICRDKNEEAANESVFAADLPEEALHIVRRMLRYRGGASADQTAARYGWQPAVAEEILMELCRRGEAVKQEETYYHAKLYRRARTRTIRKRREEIRTHAGEDYAALLLSRVDSAAPAKECLEHALKQYAGITFPAAYWEEVILPARVRGYRENMLDSCLAEGELFWHMAEGGLRFDRTEDIDWDADPKETVGMPAVDRERADESATETTDAGKSAAGSVDGLTEKEQLLYERLLKRGASFMQSLNSLFPGESPHDTLLSLAEKGLLCADSYVPVRQWQSWEKTRKAAVKQRVGARVKAMNAGRWDVVRPLREPSAEERLNRAFDCQPVLCRETASACGLPWQEALSLLRIWEYTGQARRGYFVEGFSGAQFIRGTEYAGIVRALEHPEEKLVWINAADPAQCWGKLLPHREGRSFINVPGTLVACHAGIPVAVLERQGKTLRVFEDRYLAEGLMLFAEEYRRGKLFRDKKRIVVKEYQNNAAEALSGSGFLREMGDYVLYR